MENNPTLVYYAKTINDIKYHIKNIPNIVIMSGCTSVGLNNNSRKLCLPDALLFIDHVNELKQVNRTERYIDFGSCVTFSQILFFGSKKIPKVLFKAIQNIGSTQLRNMATIGGNICIQEPRGSIYASLLALDAKIELVKTDEDKSILLPLTKFNTVPSGTFISKIRVPTEEWDIEIFKRLGPSNILSDQSFSFAFLANTQKNVLYDLRISFCGTFIFRSRELENLIIGAKLPLSDKSIQMMIDEAEEHISEFEISSFTKKQFLNLLYYSFEKLT